MTDFLFKKDYIPLYILLIVVYLSGLWIPLMENDSAQHATMAMRMYLENDFLNIYKGGKDYLDKPHMHFWLAALSFKIFGVLDWVYRIPALLFTVIAAVSCYGLAKEFYGKQARHIASLTFLSAQAIFLSNHDVRTDAVLTGATIFGVWQLVLYVNHQRVINAILGSIGVAIAFSTKGQLGVFVAGICILAYLLYNRKWNVIWSWKTLVGILCFFASIFPVLYAYYVQFDLHPEKIIQGQSNISGVRFILWDQSFNRLTAAGFEETSPDYFFFFHTMLWAFLPWSIVAYLALFNRCRELWVSKFAFKPKLEALTSLGVLTVLIVISFSKFKLPHYLNSLLPILSVLVAGYLTELYNKNKKNSSKVLLILQYIALTVGSVFVLFLIFWAFPMPHVGIVLCYLLLLAGLSYVITTKMGTIRKLIVISVSYMIFINFCLNTQFYPKLLLYQAGNNTARVINSENIDSNNVFKLSGKPSWSLDFYTKRITPTVPISEISSVIKSGQWLFLYGNQLESLKAANISWSKKYEIYHHRITRLSLEFLNPNTRDGILEKAYLLRIE
ncbi:ArnT family glycosyltransferase [Aquimarina sp. LLG6339-5]|uniref:ArnT family glycosyltransferase n=1 Tax=Aquimarina sp. LLG6339-5 TaxID=3160830 RepID=UPI0038658C12